MCTRIIRTTFKLLPKVFLNRLYCQIATTPAPQRQEHYPYDLHQLVDSPAVDPVLTPEEALLYFRQLHLIRKMELLIAQLYQKRQIRGFCHLYVGQEACAVGLRAAMRPVDTVITSYRCHAWPLVMEGNDELAIKGIIAELLGKKTGFSKGMGGSMHMFGKNFYGGHGIVGAHIPLGTGIALAHKYQNNGGICFTLMGEGAANNGQVYEAFNMAKLLKLPVIYIIENNHYGMGTSAIRSSANPDFYKRGDTIPGIRTSGMEVLTVREAAKFAVEHVKNGNGPIILELLTYRYYGHSLSDPGTSYRTREEIREIRENHDPIKLLLGKILNLDLISKDDIQTIEKETKALVEKCRDDAAKDPDPGLDSLKSYIYEGKI